MKIQQIFSISFNLFNSLKKRPKSFIKDLSLKPNTIQPQKTKEFSDFDAKVKDYFRFTLTLFNTLIIKDLSL
jgi:hypothetical protein